jgi:hypothetical protein
MSVCEKEEKVLIEEKNLVAFFAQSRALRASELLSEPMDLDDLHVESCPRRGRSENLAEKMVWYVVDPNPPCGGGLEFSISTSLSVVDPLNRLGV